MPTHIQLILLASFCLITACSWVKLPANLLQEESQKGFAYSTLLPKEEKTLLIIGQDNQSLEGYSRSGLFPVPGGVTTYLAFYQLTRSTFPEFGALGIDNSDEFYDKDIDWGAGPLNAAKLARNYPQSALVIGLNIAEGSGQTVWADGGLADIAVGVHDKKILKLSRFLKSIPNPVYLRIGYEFDGAWNRGYQKHTSYILAYKRIVDVLRKSGVNNVAYVWQASASPVDDVIDGYHEDITRWYPGDEYVDWMGLSWFLFPDESQHSSPTQKELADEVMSFARDKNKPVMIAESAPQRFNLNTLSFANNSEIWDGPAAGSKQTKTAADIWQEWFVPFFEYIETNRDVIRAVAYINANWNAQDLWSKPYNKGYWGDSRLEMTPGMNMLWSKEVKQKQWLHGSNSLPNELIL